MTSDSPTADAEMPGDDAGRHALLYELGEAAPLISAAAGGAAWHLQLDAAKLTDPHCCIAADYPDERVLLTELGWCRKIDAIATARIAERATTAAVRRSAETTLAQTFTR
jgi:hypothetical protein